MNIDGCLVKHFNSYITVKPDPFFQTPNTLTLQHPKTPNTLTPQPGQAKTEKVWLVLSIELVIGYWSLVTGQRVVAYSVW